MNKLELYVVRHGETKWNKEGKLQGWLDSALTEEGIEQAKQLRNMLQKISFDAVYSSPSKRAMDTATILVEDAYPIVLDPRLQEIHLGNWQGKLIKDIEQEDQDRYNAYYFKPAEYIPNGGEAFGEVIERMNAFFLDCIKWHEKGSVLIVSHGVAIRALLLSILQWPVDKIWDFNEIHGASVTKIVVEGNSKLVEYVGKEPLDMIKS